MKQLTMLIPFVMLLLAGCSSGPTPQDIAGTWQLEGGGWTVTFTEHSFNDGNRDGTYEIKGNSILCKPGRYTMEFKMVDGDDKAMIFVAGGLDSAQEFKGQVLRKQ